MYARLRGMVLYLHKDEDGFRRRRYETFNNAIMLHHSLASRCENYKKRQHIFRLRTANLGEYLFQTRYLLVSNRIHKIHIHSTIFI